MKPLSIALKAAALYLASVLTASSAALLHVAVLEGSRAPIPYLTETDAGCDLDPSQLC